MADSVLLIIIGAILILVCLLLAVMLIRTNAKIKSLEKKYKRFMRGSDGISLAESFSDEFDKLDRFSDDQKMLRASVNELRNQQKLNYSKYGIVKYDAFEDVGGKLSFALAFLNETDSGFVLNAIHSKDNCFLYLKEIVNGESYIMLSNEEIKALQSAKATTKAEEVLIDTNNSSFSFDLKNDINSGNIEKPQKAGKKSTVADALHLGKGSLRKSAKNRRVHDPEMERSMDELRDIERANVADELKDMDFSYEEPILKDDSEGAKESDNF